MNFADRLFAAVDAKATPAIVGLDPRPSMLPPPFEERVEQGDVVGAVRDFLDAVVDVVSPLVPAVKPNLAFFEVFGARGWEVLQHVVHRARDAGLLVIADAKRGDIGSTAAAYAEALFTGLGADAVTLNAYLGEDSIAPFLEYGEKGQGCFLLVKTSNPSSRDVQDLDTGAGKVFERLADLVSRWGDPYRGTCGYSAVGAVVGATFPEEAAKLRERMPSVPFLLPGYGAQGGSAADVVSAFDERGYGAVVNSSRGILYAHRKYSAATGFEDAILRATHAMREDLANVFPDAAWRRPGAGPA